MRTALHLFPSFALGGSQRRLGQVASRLDGWRHVIVPLDGDRSADAMMGGTERSYQEVELRKGGGASLRNLSKLGKLIAGSGADILCTYNWGAVEGALANRLGPRLPHLHFEDGFGPEEAERLLPRRNLARRAALGGGRTKVVVPSRGLERIAREAWGLSEARIACRPNGVDLERFSPTAKDGPFRVCYLGALRPEKNVGRLIAAAGKVGVPLDVWGDGPERAPLETLAALEVRFRGPTDRPEDALAEAHLLALSSDTEQMPLTVLEAMAAGLPVLATDVGDTRAMVAEENARFVTALGDERAYTVALRTLTNDAGLRAHLGAANRAKAKAEFGATERIGAHAALFEEAASWR